MSARLASLAVFAAVVVVAVAVAALPSGAAALVWLGGLVTCAAACAAF